MMWSNLDDVRVVCVTVYVGNFVLNKDCMLYCNMKYEIVDVWNDVLSQPMSSSFVYILYILVLSVCIVMLCLLFLIANVLTNLVPK